MLENIAFKNFKLLKDQAFIFNNLTIFSGLNGMGKSSVIQGLLLLRQSFEKNMLPKKGLALVGDYVKIGTGADLLCVDAEDEFIDLDLVWKNSISLALSVKCMKESNVQKLVKEETKGDCYSQSLFSSSFQYLSADRISPKSSYDVSDYDVKELGTIGIKGEYTAHFIAEKGLSNISIPALRHKAAKSDNLIASIDAWMSEITPGTKVVALVLPQISQASLHYQFEISKGQTKLFRPENTGFGLTYVLPIVTAVLNSRPGDLLLIENPESHLHPAGQSAIARLLSIAAENGVQIVIETHSDHLLNGFRASVKNKIIAQSNLNLYYLSRDVDSAEHVAKVASPQIDINGKIDKWPKGFFDEWDNNLKILVDEN